MPAMFFARSRGTSKVNKYAGSRAARSIVGQPRSTIEPSGWLRSGAIVVVNTAKGTIGADTAALIGGSLINLVSLLIGAQATLRDDQRRPSTPIVDEFHTMPGADYEGILSELSKYGASLVLATQSLARLEALDRDQGRSLRATVFANLDGLFAFHTSAEDARYLVQELGEEIDEHDLVELGEHQCDPKLSSGGERLPTFSVALDPPPASDPIARDQIIELSSALFGRDQKAIEDDLRSALARIELLQGRKVDGDNTQQSGKGTGTPGKLPNETTSTTKRVRTNKSTKPPKPGEALQGTLIDAMHDGERGDDELMARDEPIPAPTSDKAEGDER
jgi:hypothetical protein